jgi:hypothetical protein
MPVKHRASARCVYILGLVDSGDFPRAADSQIVYFSHLVPEGG